MMLTMSLLCALESMAIKGVRESKAQLSQSPNFTDEKIVTQSKHKSPGPIPSLLVLSPAVQTL